MHKTKLLSVAAWAGVLCSGCAGRNPQPDWRNLPADRPAVGSPTLMTDQRDKTIYGTAIALCNRSPYPLRVHIKVESGASEMPHMPHDTTYTAPSGSHFWAGLSDIRRQRKHPIRYNIQWQRGGETGGYVYTIPTNATNE